MPETKTIPFFHAFFLKGMPLNVEIPPLFSCTCVFIAIGNLEVFKKDKPLNKNGEMNNYQYG